MRDCFFFHNPKAGGTSLRHALAAYFSQEEVAPSVDHVPEVCGGPRAAALTPGYRLYIGHFGRNEAQSVLTNHVRITNFRHPVSRVVSLYNYFRNSVPMTPEVLRDPKYYAVRLAKSAAIETFVRCEDPRVTTYIRDHHFRQLCRDGWSLSLPRPPPEPRSVVDGLDWIYVCEHPEISLRWGRCILEAPDLLLGRENRTQGPPQNLAETLNLSQDTFRHILEINPLDIAVYEEAVGRVLMEARGVSERRSRPAVRSDVGVNSIVGSRLRRFGVPTAAALAALAVGAVATTLAAQEHRRPLPPQIGQPSSQALASLRQHLQDSAKVLDRGDLLTLASYDDPAQATARLTLRKLAAGRRFVVESSLGCGDAPAAVPMSSARWWVDLASNEVKVRLEPTAWPVSGPSRVAPLFWISRPANNAWKCPAGSQRLSEEDPVAGTRVGLVQNNPPGDWSHPASEVRFPIEEYKNRQVESELRLRIEGNLESLPSEITKCPPSQATDFRDCIVLTKVEKISIVRAGAHGRSLWVWITSPRPRLQLDGHSGGRASG